MNTSEPFLAFSRNVQFVEAVAEQLGIVFDELLSAPEGAHLANESDEWDGLFGSRTFKIRVQREKEDMATGQILFVEISSRGLVEVEDVNWTLDGDEHHDDSSILTLPLDMNGDPTEAAATIIGGVCTQPANEVSNALRKYCKRLLGSAPEPALRSDFRFPSSDL
ncbi:hypothetical protein [Litoreibacter roseus]|uniref:Uncharacterized protein n=1 Tax=Litoreibacter roseus TaxID=2601869 RepID=A0A6N6JIA1_9RHOB|nr:hypothetical protein [Litoreibacter roseus]GFE65550.1 hypothetical protein KIN_26240 [Litoreibacter roseus]